MQTVPHAAPLNGRGALNTAQSNAAHSHPAVCLAQSCHSDVVAHAQILETLHPVYLVINGNMNRWCLHLFTCGLKHTHCGHSHRPYY